MAVQRPMPRGPPEPMARVGTVPAAARGEGHDYAVAPLLTPPLRNHVVASGALLLQRPPSLEYLEAQRSKNCATLS
jgi:hypothetical protein